MEENIHKKKFFLVLMLSSASLFLFIVEQMVSIYRNNLFGFDPEVAGYNMLYNFLILFPMILIETGLGTTALIIYLRTRKEIKLSNAQPTWIERFSLVPLIIPLVFLLRYLIFPFFNIWLFLLLSFLILFLILLAIKQIVQWLVR
jgi:hypothetical protein